MDQEEKGRRSCGSYEANVVHKRYSDNDKFYPINPYEEKTIIYI